MTRSSRFRVDWTTAALDDLTEIVLHSAEERPSTSDAIASRIEVRASTLALFPDRGRVVPELAAHGVQDYRELIEAPWRLVHRIAGRRLYVLGVLDSRRSLEDVLLERLLRWQPLSPRK